MKEAIYASSKSKPICAGNWINFCDHFYFDGRYFIFIMKEAIYK